MVLLKGGNSSSSLGRNFYHAFPGYWKDNFKSKNPFLLCKKMRHFFLNEPLQNTDISQSFLFWYSVTLTKNCSKVHGLNLQSFHHELSTVPIHHLLLRRATKKNSIFLFNQEQRERIYRRMPQKLLSWSQMDDSKKTWASIIYSLYGQ